LRVSRVSSHPLRVARDANSGPTVTWAPPTPGTQLPRNPPNLLPPCEKSEISSSWPTRPDQQILPKPRRRSFPPRLGSRFTSYTLSSRGTSLRRRRDARCYARCAVPAYRSTNPLQSHHDSERMPPCTSIDAVPERGSKQHSAHPCHDGIKKKPRRRGKRGGVAQRALSRN
jgi:hypothetical protein